MLHFSDLEFNYWLVDYACDMAQPLLDGGKPEKITVIDAHLARWLAGWLGGWVAERF